MLRMKTSITKVPVGMTDGVMIGYENQSLLDVAQPAHPADAVPATEIGAILAAVSGIMRLRSI